MKVQYAKREWSWKNEWIQEQQAEKLQSLDELYSSLESIENQLTKARFTDSRTLQN